MTAPGHMTRGAFLAEAARVARLIADYHDGPARDAPVLCPLAPGETAARLPDDPPERPEAWDDILRDVREIVLPGLTHWQSPNFFAYFPANASGPGTLADFLCAGLGVQGMLWRTGPACTELETRVLDWLRDLLGLPERFDSRRGPGAGVIQGTASEAVLVALVAARHRAAARGADPAGVTAYASEQAHSSLQKAAMIAGLPEGAMRTVPTTSDLAMDPGALARLMDEDARAGRTPCFACATLGTTSTGAFDPLRPIAEAARERGAWVHVDGAWAGSAMVCPEFRGPADGADLADSFNVNPHKWLLTNFDCSALWVADRSALTDALSVTPEYLRHDTPDAIDYRDWQVPLGRRFRALKLWFVIRHYGAAGLRAHVREHVRLAEWLEAELRADPRFEIAAARSLSLLCFRLAGARDEPTMDLMERLNDSGRLFLSHTRVPTPSSPDEPRYVIRVAIGSTPTEEAHVRAAWDMIRSEAPD